MAYGSVIVKSTSISRSKTTLILRRWTGMGVGLCDKLGMELGAPLSLGSADRRTGGDVLVLGNELKEGLVLGTRLGLELELRSSQKEASFLKLTNDVSLQTVSSIKL